MLEHVKVSIVPSQAFFRYNYIRITTTNTTYITKEYKCVEKEGCPERERIHYEYERDTETTKSNVRKWEKEQREPQWGTITSGKFGEGDDCTCRPYANPNKYW